MKIVLATGNPGKVREITRALRGLGLEVCSLKDAGVTGLPPETGSTFEENALIKARYVAGATGQAALADDSGLEVDAMGGAPGVYSARYAGAGAGDRENFLKLLKELQGVPEARRSARFVSVVAYVEPGGLERTFTGRLEGVITEEPRGEGGFGYDPVFYIPGLKRTAAEITTEEKNRLSHRGRAISAFRAWFASRPAGHGV